MIHDLQDMAKQFTREWEIWKLTNEAAAGRNDGEKVEREKRMAEARKVRDRIREEMLREEEERDGGRRVRWDDGGGGGSGSDGDVSPPWDGGNSVSGNISGKAPWDQPSPAAKTSGRASWDEPSPGTPTADNGAQWDRPSPKPDTSGRATWDEPSPRPTTSGRALWDKPSPSTPTASNRASWDEPSPTPNISSRAVWDEPTNSGSAPWNNSLFDPGRESPTHDLSNPTPSVVPWNQPIASTRGRVSWDDPDASHNSGRRSPTYNLPSSSRDQTYQQSTSEQSTRQWNEPTRDNDTYNSGGRTLTREQRLAPPTASAPWNKPTNRTQSSRASWDDPVPSPPRDPNSAGEQAYLSRPPAVITGDLNQRAWNEPAGGSAVRDSDFRDYQRLQAAPASVASWDAPSRSGNDGRARWEQEDRSRGNNESEDRDAHQGNDNGGSDDGEASPQWSGEYGGDTPDPGNSGRGKAPWDYY